MTSSEDNEFLRRAKRGLDDMERHLDSATIGRLRTARVQAIDNLNKPPERASPSWMLPAAVGLAATIVIAVALTLVYDNRQVQLPTAGIEDLELIATEDSLDFYVDMEFYQWLTESHDAG